MAIEHSIATNTHGRYLIDYAQKQAARFLIVGFHGYTENADLQLQRLQELNRNDAHLCSIQALHRFYKQEQIAASWMCSQDRELHIQDNIQYINRVLDQLKIQCQWQQLIICGFSQGAAMAYRSALYGKHNCDGLFINGGDIPPELTASELAKLCPCTVVAGNKDQFYTTEKITADQQRLSQAQFITFDGKHAWPSSVNDLFNDFLNTL